MRVSWRLISSLYDINKCSIINRNILKWFIKRNRNRAHFQIKINICIFTIRAKGRFVSRFPKYLQLQFGENDRDTISHLMIISQDLIEFVYIQWIIISNQDRSHLLARQSWQLSSSVFKDDLSDFDEHFWYERHLLWATFCMWEENEIR
jgi:hypothetical protein